MYLRQIMAALLQAIGVTLEEKVLKDVNKSPYFSLIMDEVTDISVTKQHGLCSIPCSGC